MYVNKEERICNSDFELVVFELTHWWLVVTEAMTSGFRLVGTQIMVCQTAAVMEILHPAMGLVKSSAIAPLLQVWSHRVWDHVEYKCSKEWWLEIPIFLITLYLLNKVYVYQSTCGEFANFVFISLPRCWAEILYCLSLFYMRRTYRVLL